MNIRPTEYAGRGLLGIGTPQANPTVEAELCALRPRGVGLVTARLVCPDRDPQRRLLSYIDDLEQTLVCFDNLRLDAFGFACTGSSYLRGYTAERELVTRLQDRRGYPVITAAAAIEASLKTLGARNIAMVTPYPEWLLEPSVTFWQGRGLRVEVSGQVRLPGTELQQIYELHSDQALEVLRGMALDGVDAVLFSGTGMPSLRALLTAQAETGLPAISSNLALARALFDAIGMDGDALTAPTAWSERITAL